MPKLNRYIGLKFSKAIIYLKRPRLKIFKNYIFATKKVWRIIWYSHILWAIFFGTFWISTNREVYAMLIINVQGAKVVGK